MGKQKKTNQPNNHNIRIAYQLVAAAAGIEKLKKTQTITWSHKWIDKSETNFDKFSNESERCQDIREERVVEE